MTGRRAKTINALLQETAFTYDLAGNQRSMTDARGHTVLTDYDDLNRPTRVT